MSAPAPRIGAPVASVETPALVIDADAMERNIERLAVVARERHVRLRPHAKTHKSAAIARLQIAAGAIGICVQKLSEAEALAAAGIDDIYISNEVVDPAKLARLAALATRIRLAVAVDSRLGVERLAAAMNAINATRLDGGTGTAGVTSMAGAAGTDGSTRATRAASAASAARSSTRASAALDVFVEIDVGHGRCGVPPAAAGALAHQVVAAGLRFAGLQAYHGRAQHLRGAEERAAAIRHAVALARAAQASITSAGIACPLVTGAGTGTFMHEAASGLYGELQCGSYLFMDRDYADNEPSTGGPVFEHALFVKSQVMSRGLSHAVIDAGHKSHAIDSGLPRVWGRDLQCLNGGDEHSVLRSSNGAPLPGLGETVWLVPGHCDPTVNLHEHYVVLRGGLEAGSVEAIWPVDARGCVQ